MIKGTGRPHGDHPAEGSYLHKLFQLLHDHKGRPVRVYWKQWFLDSRQYAGALTSLEDIYGLDIRDVPGKKGWKILAGEWFGKVYIDYVAETITAGPT